MTQLFDGSGLDYEGVTILHMKLTKKSVSRTRVDFTCDMKGGYVIVTGGPGFIGSHLVEKPVEANGVAIIDNQSTEKLENVSHLISDNLKSSREVPGDSIWQRFLRIMGMFFIKRPCGACQQQLKTHWLCTRRTSRERCGF
jgi:hypothetical protein